MSTEDSTYKELWGAARLIGVSCKDPTAKFYDCKLQTDDPEKCLEEGDNVTKCAGSVLKTIHTHCPDEFSSFVECLDKGRMEHSRCRKLQSALHTCYMKAT